MAGLRVLATCVALVVAVSVGVAVSAATGSTESDSSACIKAPRHATVGHGVSPGGQKWYVTSLITNNAMCRARLLEITFHPFGPSGVSWAAGYGIPVGGSLSSTFVIASQQVKNNGEIAYGGVVSARVAVVEAAIRGGGWSKIEPQKPQAVNPPRWLRNVRYFVEYLPANEKVERIRVRDWTGRVLYQGGESVFGEFEDPGVL
jgi:hypothetical protein